MITDRDFKKMTDDCNAEIEQAEKEIDALNAQLDTSEEYKAKIARIRKVLADAQKDAAKGTITKEFVEQYIDKILATPQEDGSLLLDIKIFTGETAQKTLSEIPRRTGHMFKRMIEQQERQMSGKYVPKERPGAGLPCSWVFIPIHSAS